MKKIGKKINYLVKVFMAVGLLFTNIMPLSVILADELDNQEIVGDNNLDNELGNNQGGDNNDQNDEAEVVFSAELNDENQIIIKYTGEYAEDWTLNVVENITYLDGNTSDDAITDILLTEEIKAMLNEGYVLDSTLLANNIYPGVYVATVTLGENNKVLNKTIEYEESGFGYGLVAVKNGSDGELIGPDDSGKFVVDKETESLGVVASVGQGSACPSMSFVYGEDEYTAEDLLEGISLEDFELNGHLYSEFALPLAGTFTDCDGVATDYGNSSLNVVYGTYQDNTDKLNESAKNVELGNKYTFFGNSAEGYVYNLDEIDTTELEKVVEAFAGESEFIQSEIKNDDNGLALTLTDSYGTEVTYTNAKASSDTQIGARLEANSDEISTGDEFTVSYVVAVKDYKVNGVGGLVTYDEELLKLTGFKAGKFVGNNLGSKFVYVGEALSGTETTDGEDNKVINEEEYIVLTLTFEALKAGEANIAISDAKFYNEDIYYGASEEISTSVIIDESNDNSLSSLKVAGQDIQLEEGKLEYEITVSNGVTQAKIEVLAANVGAQVTSIVIPEELAVGENIITITVMAENGDERVYTIKVTREAAEDNQGVVSTISYQEDTSDDSTSGEPSNSLTTTGSDNGVVDNNDMNTGKKVTRVIIIILILLAIAGLVYLIFKDEDDEETKRANKDIEKFKKEDNKNSKKVDNNKKAKKKGR